jgi:hypothetical protein
MGWVYINFPKFGERCHALNHITCTRLPSPSKLAHLHHARHQSDPLFSISHDRSQTKIMLCKWTLCLHYIKVTNVITVNWMACPVNWYKNSAAVLKASQITKQSWETPLLSQENELWKANKLRYKGNPVWNVITDKVGKTQGLVRIQTNNNIAGRSLLETGSQQW